MKKTKQLFLCFVSILMTFSSIAQSYNWQVYSSAIPGRTYSKAFYYSDLTSSESSILSFGASNHSSSGGVLVYANTLVRNKIGNGNWFNNTTIGSVKGTSCYYKNNTNLQPNNEQAWIVGNAFSSTGTSNVYNTGVILKNNGGASNFITVSSNTGMQYSDIEFSHRFSGVSGAAVGKSISPTGNPPIVSVALVSYTLDQGSTWTTISAFNDNNGESRLNALSWGSSTRVYAVGAKNISSAATGGNPLVLTSGDNGINWTEVAVSIQGITMLNDCYFINPNVGWAVGNNGKIIKTMDQGFSWTEQTTPTTQHLNSIYFLNSLAGWAVGNGGVILKTIDGGTTWETISSPVSTNLTHVQFITQNDGMIQSTDGTILKLEPCTLSTSTLTETACDSYTLNSQSYTTSGTYTQTVANAAGTCDSVITLNLTINQSTTNTINQTACSSFTLNSQTYNTTGTYTQTLQNVAGCDSTITLNLVVNQPTTSSVTEASCNPFTLNSQTYTTSGTYTQTLQNIAGCDSTITINYTRLTPTVSTLNPTICGGNYTLNNQTYTTSGTYTQNLQNVAGCDSTITINLTVGAPNTSTLTEENCGSFTLNNQTYNTSGTFTQTLQNVSGCDSVITLNLTILTPTSSVINASECASYTLNGTTYSTSGTFVQTIQNAAGCDSTITLNLTIQSNTGVATITSCDTYTWINGTTYTASNNSATFILQNAAGCDSVVTLNLTIQSINPAVTVAGTTISATQSGASYQWINCANNTAISGATSQTYTATTNGSYAVVISAGSCVDTSTCTTFNTIGIDENVKATFAIYPNPASENVTISNIEAGSTISLIDVTGKIVATQKTNSTTVNLQTVDFNTGVYFVRVLNANGKTAVQKLIIE